VGRRELLARYLRGPVTLSLGAAVLGICSYVFLTVAARGLAPEQFGELSALWALLFGFVAGLWYPVEQETTRVVAVAEDGPAPAAAVVARISALATVPALALVVVFLVSLGDRALGGAIGLGAALAVAVPAIGLASFQRGALLGRRRYGWAAWQLAADGIVRAVGVVVLGLVDAEVGWYGVLLAVAPLVAVALAAPGWRPLGRGAVGAPVPWRPVLVDLARLLAGSYLAIVLFNVGPLIVRLGGTAEETGRFMAMFVIARLPLFFAGAVVSGLLATLVRTYEQGTPQAFLRASRSAAAAAAGVSLLACVPLGLLAPWAARTFFGSAYEVDLVQSVTVAISTAGFVTALVLQGALVAAREQRAVAWSWLLAAVAFVVAAVVPSAAGSPGIGTVVAVAYLVSSVIAVVAMLLALDRAVSPRAARPDSGRSRS
jgi:O-antigen/teichoic acid export membrane protein